MDLYYCSTTDDQNSKYVKLQKHHLGNLYCMSPEEVHLCGKELFNVLVSHYGQFFHIMVGLDGNFLLFSTTSQVLPQGFPFCERLQQVSGGGGLIPVVLVLYRLSGGCWRSSGTRNEAVTRVAGCLTCPPDSRRRAQGRRTACQLSSGTHIHTVVLRYLPLLTVKEKKKSSFPQEGKKENT